MSSQLVHYRRETGNAFAITVAVLFMFAGAISLPCFIGVQKERARGYRLYASVKTDPDDLAAGESPELQPISQPPELCKM